MNIIDELKARGILNNCSDESLLQSLKGKGVYIGFDPTAGSLHLGNYIQLTILKRFQSFGYSPIAVIGGATGSIGDPSGKNEERQLLTKEQIKDNSKKIKAQIESFGFKTIDNYSFYEDMNILTFLREVGKLLNVNYMISKDIVKNRLETGISFTEFSYQLIQGWDFKELNEKHDVSIQVGGSDQWGNITAGLEIIRKTTKNKAVALTTNLLTKEDGTKFGKSVSGAIFLDPNESTPYEVYQYLFNQPDSDVEKLLLWLTFISVDEINAIMNEHNKEPWKRVAQKRLAELVTADIHGKDAMNKSVEISSLLFSGSTEKLSPEDLHQIKKSLPIVELNDNMQMLDVVKSTDVVSSNREAREFESTGAIKINGKKINSLDDKFTFKTDIALLELGKKNKVILLKVK